VGDVHGRVDLLRRLLDAVTADAATRGASDEALVVTLGDYVDRGDDSRGVLALLGQDNPAPPLACLSLMGNHERMMLDFLDDPEGTGPRWFRNGGEETMASFGLIDLPGGWDARGALLRAAMPEGIEAWLRGLPLWFRSGDVVCAHAGLDPRRPPEAQDARTLLWGMPAFRRRARRDGLWVVHGHTIVPAPEIADRRIACDTGAYYSDCLTAAALYPGEPVRFLQATM
jgi:serine/threonine protein phosphatase 1